MKRKSISKKIRFEVYKRDKFTCQYCGQKAPDVVLEIDHIKPVAKGGDNSLLNLITSCFDCNRGKRDIPLSENSVLEKQRQQMEQLQEKREQMEMLFEWRKSLDNIREESDKFLIEYIENKIIPYAVTENCKKKLLKIFHKTNINDIFLAIDKGESVYLKYDSENKLLQESANNFLNKLGGIITMNKKSPIEQKLHYIKGICRNRFYWDDREGMAILKEYVKALENYGWSDDKILEDLETEVTDLAKDVNHWTDWCKRMQKWIQDVKGWTQEEKELENKEVNDDIEEMSLEQIGYIASQVMQGIELLFEIIKYISKAFEVINKIELCENILNQIRDYIKDQILEGCSEDGDIGKLKPDYHIYKRLGLLDFVKPVDTMLKFALDNMYTTYLREWAEETIYLPNYGLGKAKDLVLFEQYFNKEIQKFTTENNLSCHDKF